MFSSIDILHLSPIPLLEPSTGSSRTMCMSNLSAGDWVHGLLGAQISLGLLINLGLPLSQGAGWWVEETFISFPFPVTFSLLAPMLWNVASLADRGMSPLGSLGFLAEIINESQYLLNHLSSSTTYNLINEK
jgi:hypothetical protein